MNLCTYRYLPLPTVLMIVLKAWVVSLIAAVPGDLEYQPTSTSAQPSTF